MIHLGKRFRYPLYGLGVFATVTLGSIVWLGSSVGEEWVRARLEQSISGAMLGGRAELDSFSTNGFSHFEVGGLKLVDAGGKAVVSLDELVVDLNPLAIVLSRVSIESIGMTGLGLEVEVDEEGVVALAEMFASGQDEQDGGEFGFDVFVGEFRVSDVNINYSAATVGAADPVEHLVTLDLQGGFQMAEGVSRLPHISGQAAVDGTNIEFEAEVYSSPIETNASVVLSGVGSRVVGAGSYSPWLNGEESWQLNLSELELDLQALGELVEVPLLGRIVASVAGEQGGGVVVIGGNLTHGSGGLTVATELTEGLNSLTVTPRDLNLSEISPLVSELVILSGELKLSSDTFAGMVSPEIEIHLVDSIIWGIDVSTASLLGRFDGEELAIDEFLIESPLLSASASGVVGAGGAELSLALSDVDARQLQPFGAPSMTGMGAATGEVSINWAEEEVEIDWDGSIALRRISYMGSTSLRTLTGPFRASARGARFSASGESVIEGIRSGETTAELVDLQWSVDKADSMEWSSTVSVDSLSSGGLLVNWITGRVAGSGDSVHGRLDLTLINGLTQVWPSGTLRFDLRDRFRFTGSILGGGSNELAIDIVSDRGFSEFELKEFSVALGDQAGWATTGPTIIRRGGDSLAVRGLELVSDGGGAVRLDATGSMSGPISANLHLAQFPLDWVEPWIEQSGFEGLISGDVTIGGRSESLRVEADLSGVGLLVPNTISGLDCQLSLSVGEESVGWEAEIMSAGISMANLSGSLPARLSLSGADLDWAGPFEIDGVMAPVSNSHWRDGVPALSGLPEGRSSASISMEGTLREPVGGINAGVAWRLGADNRQFRVDLGLELDEAQVSMVGAGRTGGVHLFDLRGSVGTAFDEALSSLAGDDVAFPSSDEWIESFEVGLAPMGVSVDLLRGFLPLPEALEGLVSGSISLVGGATEPRAVVGVSLAEGSFGQAQIPSAVLSLVPTDDHYELSLFGAVGVGSLVVSGSLPFGDADTQGLDLEVVGPELPLELITGLVPEMTNVVGNISLEGQVRGSIAAPEPRVVMSLPNGEFNMPSLGVGFSELLVEAVLTESGVDITRFSGETEKLDDIGADLFDSNGSFEGALEYLYDGGLAGGFVCDNLSLSATSKQTFRTTGHLSVEGPIESVNVVGEFVVDEGRYVLTSSDWLTNSEVELSSAITLHRDGAEFAIVVPEEPSIFDGWSMALGLDLAQNTWIDVSMPLDDTFGSVTSAVSTVGLNGRLDGQLQVDYSPERISSNEETGEVLRSGGLDVVGELLVIRGNTKVFGKDFAVDDGSVRFTGGGVEEPELDISATHSNREYGDIVVDIAGQPRQMSLSFSASEGWSDTDMASILLLGRPVSSLTQSEGGAGLNLVGTALGVMAGTASNLVQMSSMVDTIEVESEGESISSLSVGWALGSDLFVTYSRDYTALAGENISEITLEWLISKRIQAELSTGDRGQSSADLYMKWRF